MFNFKSVDIKKMTDEELLTLSSKELEKLADLWLQSELKCKKKNKSKTEEYNILSKSQLFRRYLKEIPYSSLTKVQRLRLTKKNWEYEKGDE